MIECTTEQSSLTFKWTFNRMMPSLPTPGTTAFATLCRALQPYGISPSGISLQAPTNWLSDVSLRISLLEAERAVLQITYGGFELSVKYLLLDDDVKLLELLNGVFVALREIDEEVYSGTPQLTLEMHLSFLKQDVSSFLQDHLSGGSKDSGFVPRGFVYELPSGNAQRFQESLVVGAKSLMVENALMVTIAIEYSSPVRVEEIGERFTKDCQQIITMLGLEPRPSSKTEGAS